MPREDPLPRRVARGRSRSLAIVYDLKKYVCCDSPGSFEIHCTAARCLELLAGGSQKTQLLPDCCKRSEMSVGFSLPYPVSRVLPSTCCSFHPQAQASTLGGRKPEGRILCEGSLHACSHWVGMYSCLMVKRTASCCSTSLESTFWILGWSGNSGSLVPSGNKDS